MSDPAWKSPGGSAFVGGPAGRKRFFFFSFFFGSFAPSIDIAPLSVGRERRDCELEPSTILGINGGLSLERRYFLYEEGHCIVT